MYTLPNDSYLGKYPEIDPEAFIAPGAVVLGDVKMAKYSSLWPCAVVRGDVSYIRIGEASNVQDCACLHVANDGPCIIGDYVTIGHGAIVHACTVGDNVLIGMNATVLTGAKIGRSGRARQGKRRHPAELARRRRAGRGEEADQPHRFHPCAGHQVQDGLGEGLRCRPEHRRRAVSWGADCIKESQTYAR